MLNYGFRELTPDEEDLAVKSSRAKLRAFRRSADDVLYPKTLDYRKFQVGKTFLSNKNLVMPVQDQGKCGSCYMYAALQQLAAFLSLQNNKQVIINPLPFLSGSTKLSTTSEFCPPCSGGNSYTVLQSILSLSTWTLFILPNPMIRSLALDVPPASSPLECSGTTCFKNPDLATQCTAVYATSVTIEQNDLISTSPGTALPLIPIQPYTYVAVIHFPTCMQDAEHMLTSVLNVHGPVTLAIYMTPGAKTLQAPYIYDTSMIPVNMAQGFRANHELMCIGYKKIRDKSVWILQNSWGKQWGDSGIFYLPRGISQPDLGGWTIEQWQQWPQGPGNIFGTEYTDEKKKLITRRRFMQIITAVDAGVSQLCNPSVRSGHFKNPFSRPPDCTCEDGYQSPECATCTNSNMNPNEGCDYCTKGLGFKAPDCMACKAGFEGIDCTACVNKLLQFPFCNISCPNPKMAPPGCSACMAKWTGSQCTKCPSQYDSETCSLCKNPRFDAKFSCTTCKDPNSDFSTGCETCINDRMIPSLAADRCDCKIPFTMKIDDQCTCKERFTGPMCNQCSTGRVFPDC